MLLTQNSVEFSLHREREIFRNKANEYLIEFGIAGKIKESDYTYDSSA